MNESKQKTNKAPEELLKASILNLNNPNENKPYVSQINGKVSRVKSKKNVTLIPYVCNGINTYKLIGESGEVESFAAFAKLLKRNPFNTRQSYCQRLAGFFDYFYEASFHLIAADPCKTGLSKSELKLIIESWHEYLTVGLSSGVDIVRKVCTTLPSPYVSHNTSANMHAPLRKFLQLSERIREESQQLVKLGLMSKKSEYDVAPLFDEINGVLAKSFPERLAQIRNSMMAGVIAGGPHLKAEIILESRQAFHYDDGRAFPLESLSAFIDCLPTFRDKALYSFYAASGCRSNEALQLLLQDVVVDERNPSRNKVNLVDPKRRINHPSYLALLPEESEKLSWKGRQTDETFLIEPFASMFFEFLAAYLCNEYCPHNKHTFLFQVLKKGMTFGTPYFLSKPSSRQEIFRNAARKIGLPEDVKGPHSLRHAYGTYLLNYLPLGDNKYGLPMGIVRVMMGHTLIRSTEKYAKHDKDIIEAHLSIAHSLLYQHGNPNSYIQQKIDAMRAQISKLESTAITLVPEGAA